MWKRVDRDHRSDETLVLDCVGSNRVRREIGVLTSKRGKSAQGETPRFPKPLGLPGGYLQKNLEI
ncbi:hypothetical protein B738_26837 [Photorhabdus temperata subsp. temperata M1021]|nr:hypothetical protein B738_26837 [Photorhabdus temperata subsp. temperata M1021]